MTTKEPYSYVVLRYVHDVLTGEFVNVGLIVVIPDRPLILTQARKTFGRIKDVFPDLDSEAYKRAIDAVKRGMRSVERELKDEGSFKGEKTARDYARIALPLDDSSLQWSPVGTGLTTDPHKTFDQLYKRFVTRYDRPTKRHRTDNDVWRSLETKLKEHEVLIDFEPKQIQGNTDSVEFRHAWKNGRWHVYEPLSFDLADADNIKNKARRWLGHLAAVREGAPDDVQVHFIVGQPQSATLAPAYNNAVEILQQVPFDKEIFEEKQIDKIVHQIEGEVRHLEKHPQ